MDKSVHKTSFTPARRRRERRRWSYRRNAFGLHVRGERRSQELTPDQEVKVDSAVGGCRRSTGQFGHLSEPRRTVLTGFTIFSLQQLVDDVTEVLNFRGGRDGERDIVHNKPTETQTCLLIQLISELQTLART